MCALLLNEKICVYAIVYIVSYIYWNSWCVYV